jgi:hypothetical protein
LPTDLVGRLWDPVVRSSRKRRASGWVVASLTILGEKRAGRRAGL